MLVLTAAVIVVGCLCLLDLLMTFGVLRRLREQAAQPGRPAEPDLAPGLAPGRRPGVFAAVSTAGDAVAGPDGLRVVAFFSSSCSACGPQVAPFTDWVRRQRLGRDQVLAVVEAENDAPYVAELSAVAQVCVEPPGADLAEAFALAGFPAFFRLDAQALIEAAGFAPEALAEPTAAA
jgi:hypothetical protein